jgi:hypothetical protein
MFRRVGKGAQEQLRRGELRRGQAIRRLGRGLVIKMRDTQLIDAVELKMIRLSMRVFKPLSRIVPPIVRKNRRDPDSFVTIEQYRKSDQAPQPAGVEHHDMSGLGHASISIGSAGFA